MKRYTNQELQEFKALIQSKLATSEESYKSLKDSLSKNDNSALDTNWKFGSLEDGGETQSREEQNILANKQLNIIESLRSALIRIENKTYGICSVSGELIPKERLLAIPGATFCIQTN